MAYKDLEKRKANHGDWMQRYRDNNGERYRQYQRDWRMKNTDKSRRYEKTKRSRHRTQLLIKSKNYYIKNKDQERNRKSGAHRQLLIMLGGQCVCTRHDCWHIGFCGLADVRLLHLDHIHGDGVQDRGKHGRFTSNTPMVNYYLRHPNEAKDRLQVLCANCNWLKRFHNNEIPKKYQK